MNLVLLTEEDFQQGNLVSLTGERAEHIIKTIRVKIGDSLTVGLINNLMGIGIVTELSNTTVTLCVELNSQAPTPLPVRLILALPRPKVLRRTIAACSSFGIKEFVLINSYRVEKSYWNSPLLQPEQLNKHLTLGLEQAKDTILPSIRLAKRFKPFVEDELSSLLKAQKE